MMDLMNTLKKNSAGVLLLGSLVFLASCSWLGGKDDEAAKPAKLTDITAEIKVKKLWSHGVGAGADEFYIRLMPALAGDKVIAADSHGLVLAFSKVDGEQLWKQDLDMPVSGGVGVGSGVVVVGTSDARVAALDESSGALLWTVPVSSEILASPAIADDVVVVRTLDGRVYGLEAKNGKKRWIHDSSVPTLTMRGNSTPVIERGGVIVGKDNGKLTTLILSDGRVAWETEIGVPRGRSELERMVDIDATPLIAGDIAYVASLNGRVAAVNLADGKLIWAKDISSHEGLAVDADQLYVTDDKSQVQALSNRSGTSLWKQDHLLNRGTTAPVRFQGYIVVGDVEGYLHWMDPNDGHFVARFNVGGDPILVPPLVDGDILYVLDSDGKLAAYQIES